MSGKSKKPGTETRAAGKRGPKPQTRALAAFPRSRRKVPPGQGATRLRNSVNAILNNDSDRIARALVDKTISGNMTGARLLVELSGAKNPAAQAEEKDTELSLNEMLMCRGEWVKLLEEFDRDPPLPGESLQSYTDRNLVYRPAPPKPAA